MTHESQEALDARRERWVARAAAWIARACGAVPSMATPASDQDLLLLARRVEHEMPALAAELRIIAMHQPSG
ncbi:MAG TPA: hypothetical protein VGP22_08475 [Albitalea sp.]|nr:hypothetical protein [Albitalea sp.]